MNALCVVGVDRIKEELRSLVLPRGTLRVGSKSLVGIREERRRLRESVGGVDFGREANLRTAPNIPSRLL